MTSGENTPEQVDEILHVESDTLESEHFKSFLDYIPIAVVVSEIRGNGERIVYANLEFQRLSGQTPAAIEGRPWSVLDSHLQEDQPQRSLGRAVRDAEEYLGTFRLDRGEAGVALGDAYANVIESDDGEPKFRLLALVDVTTRDRSQREQFEKQIGEKDLLLRELQHRVKNNLQLITAVIRLEARSSRSGDGRVQLDRLAGRIESLQLLYQALMADGRKQEVDLGHYLGQIASAAMHTHGSEGIRLDLKVDYVLMSVNICLPVGLLVNELLTNAFKYAFNGRAAGTITLRCLHKDDDRCQVIVADDGIGLPDGVRWPSRGKISGLMLQSLCENAQTEWNVESAPDKGTRITFSFSVNTKPRSVGRAKNLSGPYLIESEITAAAAQEELERKNNREN